MRGREAMKEIEKQQKGREWDREKTKRHKMCQVTLVVISISKEYAQIILIKTQKPSQEPQPHQVILYSWFFTKIKGAKKQI